MQKKWWQQNNFDISEGINLLEQQTTCSWSEVWQCEAAVEDAEGRSYLAGGPQEERRAGLWTQWTVTWSRCERRMRTEWLGQIIHCGQPIREHLKEDKQVKQQKQIVCLSDYLCLFIWSLTAAGFSLITGHSCLQLRFISLPGAEMCTTVWS